MRTRWVDGLVIVRGALQPAAELAQQTEIQNDLVAINQSLHLDIFLPARNWHLLGQLCCNGQRRLNPPRQSRPWHHGTQEKKEPSPEEDALRQDGLRLLEKSGSELCLHRLHSSTASPYVREMCTSDLASAKEGRRLI